MELQRPWPRVRGLGAGRLATRLPVGSNPDVRLFPRVVARAALIAALALVVAPGFVGSRSPSAPAVIDQSAFMQVDLTRPGTMTTAPLLDPLHQSDGTLTSATVFDEQLAMAGLDPTVRVAVSQRSAPIVRLIPQPAPPKRVTTTRSTGTVSTSGSSGSGGSTTPAAPGRMRPRSAGTARASTATAPRAARP